MLKIPNIKEYGLNIYGSKPIKLPTTEFYVVYNGVNSNEIPDYQLLNNFDTDTGTINAKTKVIDIRYDKLSEEIRDKKDVLVGYLFLIDRIVHYTKFEKLSSNIFPLREKTEPLAQPGAFFPVYGFSSKNHSNQRCCC